MSDVIAVISWWIIIQALGLAVWPLAFRLLRWLPDRGYMLAKPLGLLLTGYVLWLLVSLGVLQNNLAGIGIAFAAVSGLSQWIYRRGRAKSDDAEVLDSYTSLFAWLRDHRWLVISYEGLFLAAFIAWTVFRMHVPDISSSEKPMELAFLNAINRSATFPPYDPWLAGHAISYYYFGYVLLSLFSKVTSVTAGVAFSLGNALWFALAAASGFGVTVNVILLTARRARLAAIGYGLLATLLLVTAGNYEAPLEVARVNGLGAPGFWSWLDILDLNQPYLPAEAGQPAWPPQHTTVEWWWQRSLEVIHDYPPTSISPQLATVLNQEPDVNVTSQEVIDEFPQYTFLVGDLHPHVLNLPFFLLIIGLALNLFQAGFSGDVESLIRGPRRLPLLFIYALVLGGVSFLNAWDFPTSALLLLGGWLLGQWLIRRANLRDSLSGFATLGIIAVAAYLPFYFNFQSQASGLAPNLFNGTRLSHFFVVFGPLVVLGLLFGIKLLSEVIRTKRSTLLRFMLKSGAAGLGLTLVAALATSVLAGVILGNAGPQAEWFNGTIAAMNERGITLIAHLLARLSDPWLPVMLASGLAAIVLLWNASRSNAKNTYLAIFILWLFFVGLLLTFMTEFIFVIDIFKTRMNTVFKFYYQTWTLWSCGAAFGVYYLLAGPNRVRSFARRTGLMAVSGAAIALGLFFPLLAIPSRLAEERTTTPLLDAMQATAQSPLFPNASDAYAATQWLNRNAPASSIILEATDGELKFKPARSRISSWTGLPTVLGWYVHETQWRGNDEVQSQRLSDVETMYSTTNQDEALSLLNRYGVMYVYIGPTEQKRYPAAGLAKFEQMFPVVFRQGQVTIYQVISES